jgi:ATP-binding cassette subfamily C protein
LAVLFIVARISAPAATIQSGFQHLFHSLPAYGKIRELERELKAGASCRSSDRALAAGELPSAAIEFHGVTFRHSGAGGRGDAAGGVRDLSLGSTRENSWA